MGRSPVSTQAVSRALAALIVTLLTVLSVGPGGQAAPMGGGGGGGGGGDSDKGLVRSPRFTLTSAAFPDGGTIPDTYTCSGENLSPPLQWIGAPAATQSFTLLVVDPDAPGGEFVHWVLYDLAPTTAGLPPGVRSTPRLDGGARQGVNDFPQTGYGGPCPPPGPAHRYVFTLYALDVARLSVPDQATRAQVTAAVAGRVLATAVLVGRFHR